MRIIKFLAKLWSFVGPYRFRLIAGLACGMLFALSNVALILVVKVAINAVFGGGEDLLGQEVAKAPAFLQSLLAKIVTHLPRTENPSNQLKVVLICMIPVVMFFRSLFTYFNVYLVNWASVRTIAELRARIFNHLQNLPLGFFSQASTGELISRITSDTQMLQTILGNTLASLIRDPVTVIALLITLLISQTRLTAISMLVLPLCIVPIAIYSRKVRKSARAMQGHLAELSKLMHEAFTGIRVIKAYNLESRVLAQFRNTTKKYIGHSMRVIRSNETPANVMEFLASVGIALVFIFVVFTDSASTITGPGEFFSFVISIFMLYQPVKSLVRSHNIINQAQSASQHVFDLLDTPSSILEPATPVPLVASNADIHFDNVDFDYTDKPVLREINLTIKAGQLVAVVGKSGSGKTTLVNFLPRFFDPKAGQVRIGNVDLRQVSIAELRNQIALVAQETILFHDTIRNNIEIGRPGATDAEIEAAARHAMAHEFILQKPQGYHTLVGEKGVTLSVGQRQRIAIARAILKNAPILILDEATSALDTESERAVQTALEKLMHDRTTICIAHRLSTIQKADVIVVLGEGRIIETGTHAELVQRGGVYQRLYELSFTDEPVFDEIVAEPERK